MEDYISIEYDYLSFPEYYEILLDLECLGILENEFIILENLLEDRNYFLRRILNDWNCNDEKNKSIIYNRVKFILDNFNQ